VVEEDASLIRQLRRLESYIYNLNSFVETDGLDWTAQDAVHQVRRSVADARSLVRDYQTLEDDRKSQAEILPLSIEKLEELRADIVKASQYEVIDAVDVAHISAWIEQIIERLR
jgi:signal transduction histidine kinase